MLDKNRETQNPAEMHASQTSGKRSVAEFEIVGVEVKGIPSVRLSDQPIQQPTPTPPTPPPPPTPGN